MRNQVLYVNPTIEETRIKLFESLFQYENVLINQKRIQYSAYYVIYFCFTSREKNSLKKRVKNVKTLIFLKILQKRFFLSHALGVD